MLGNAHLLRDWERGGQVWGVLRWTLGYAYVSITCQFYSTYHVFLSTACVTDNTNSIQSEPMNCSAGSVIRKENHQNQAKSEKYAHNLEWKHTHARKGDIESEWLMTRAEAEEKSVK